MVEQACSSVRCVPRQSSKMVSESQDMRSESQQVFGTIYKPRIWGDGETLSAKAPMLRATYWINGPVAFHIRIAPPSSLTAI
jgi:hypothetical protein